MAGKPKLTVAELKNCLDALEKEKTIRKELKGKLNSPQSEEEERKLAEQFVIVNQHIQKLEEFRLGEIDLA